MARNENGIPQENYGMDTELTEEKIEKNENPSLQNECQEDDSMTLNDKPLAYCYTPVQRFRMLYTPTEALEKGTIFEELYKPTEVYSNE